MNIYFTWVSFGDEFLKQCKVLAQDSNRTDYTVYTACMVFEQLLFNCFKS